MDYVNNVHIERTHQREAIEMLDTHLIYVALTAFGIAAGAGIFVAAAIIAIASLRYRPAQRRRAAVVPASAEREPALR